MIKTESIKIISANAYEVVGRKSTRALLSVWFFSIIAGTFIYYNNKSYLKFTDHGLAINTFKETTALPGENENDKLTKQSKEKNQSSADSYVLLIKNNNRLKLTRYSKINQKEQSETGIQYPQATTINSANRPVIIKRQISKPVTPKNDFSIKSIPN